MLASSPLSAMSVKSARYASVSARASGGIVVVLAEQVQDDGDAVLVARSGVFDGFRALSPATNRRAMGGIIRSTRGGSDFIVVDPDGFGTGR